MQPLVKAFMRPLQKLYCKEIEKWLHSHPGGDITVYQIGELFRNAYKRAAISKTVANASGVQVSIHVTKPSLDHMVSLCPQQTHMLLL
jgi:hypothetical protein